MGVISSKAKFQPGLRSGFHVGSSRGWGLYQPTTGCGQGVAVGSSKVLSKRIHSIGNVEVYEGKIRRYI